MNSKIITERTVEALCMELTQEEKSPVTIEKYLRDVRKFAAYLSGAEITKERLIAYKQHLTECGYAVGSINSMLISVNRYLKLVGMGDCSVRCLRKQEDSFCPEEKELTKRNICAFWTRRNRTGVYIFFYRPSAERESVSVN